MNRHYLDPALLGSYPEELAGIYGEACSDLFDREAASLRVPIDWLGIYYYTRNVVRHKRKEWPTAAARVRQPHRIHTETDWEVYPDGLEEALRWTAARYGPLPLYVTENGAAFYDPPSPLDGRVDDPLRTAYLREHLRADSRAWRPAST